MTSYVENGELSHKEEAIVELLSDPEIDELPLAEVLGIGDLKVSDFMELLKNPRFVEAVKDSIKRLAILSLRDALFALVKMAKSGSATHIKLLFELVGLIRGADSRRKKVANGLTPSKILEQLERELNEQEKDAESASSESNRVCQATVSSARVHGFSQKLARPATEEQGDANFSAQRTRQNDGLHDSVCSVQDASQAKPKGASCIQHSKSSSSDFIGDSSTSRKKL